MNTPRPFHEAIAYEGLHLFLRVFGDSFGVSLFARAHLCFGMLLEVDFLVDDAAELITFFDAGKYLFELILPFFEWSGPICG